MKLNELDLLILQTKYMQGDITTQGLCVALNSPMKDIADNVSSALLWRNYRNLSDDVLDALALALNITWYDSTETIEVKRLLVEKSDEVHLFQGTAKCIKLVFEAWNVTLYILEWFNYGGEPFHYKIIIGYSYYEPVYDSEGEVVFDSEGEQVFALLETPFLPDGTLMSKLESLLPFLQPARCVLDLITTTDDVTQNTYADVEALGIYDNLENRLYWDLQYII